MLQRWYSPFNRVFDCREKETLTTQDAQDAKAFSKKPPSMLQPEGMNLKLDTIANFDYIATM